MLTAPQLEGLTIPVIKRAAVTELGLNGFTDRAAQFVLERLGLLSECQNVDCVECEAQIRCSSWIDEHVTRFLVEYPDAQGIEVAGGLSTRFHRISDAMDWPRFSWQCINKPDVNDCLNYVFSEMENYRSIASEAPHLSWSKYLGWKGATRAIVLIGEDRPLEGDRDVNRLLENIRTIPVTNLPNYEFIIRHKVPRLLESLNHEFPGAISLAQFNAAGLPARSLKHLIQRLLGLTFNSPAEQLVCLGFDPE